MQRIEDDTLLIRYELKDSSNHMMDAKVEAEASLCKINAVNYVSKVLGVNNNLLTGSLKEGSVIKMFGFLTEEREDTKWIRYILVLIFSRLFFENKKVRMEDLTRGLSEQDSERIESTMMRYKVDAKLLNRINSHIHFRKARTEFFKHLSAYRDIQAIEIKFNDFENLNVADLRIESSQFGNYIEKFEPETRFVEHAKVYIVSPVIVKGKNIKWRGQFEGENTSFEMLDNVFTTRAQNAEIDFRTGFYIDCQLQFEETIDEAEIPVRKNCKVLEVYGHGHDDNYTEMPKKKKNSVDEGQPTLFDGMDGWK